jgi:Carbohydrate-binding module 48 (Isoamylase N-terminal domain)
VNNGFRQSIAASDCASDAPSFPGVASKPHPKWATKEGLPLPLGVSWVEDEQAFNFALYAERAESVRLLLYSPHDFANPMLTFQFDSICNKS